MKQSKIYAIGSFMIRFKWSSDGYQITNQKDVVHTVHVGIVSAESVDEIVIQNLFFWKLCIEIGYVATPQISQCCSLCPCGSNAREESRFGGWVCADCHEPVL